MPLVVPLHSALSLSLLAVPLTSEWALLPNSSVPQMPLSVQPFVFRNVCRADDSSDDDFGVRPIAMFAAQDDRLQALTLLLL